MNRTIAGHNKSRRHRRIEARRQDMQNMVQVIVSSTEPLRRGFFGRLKWLLMGR